MDSVYRVIIDNGYILHTTGVGEADRLITILTENYGILNVFAKSIRKETSKMRTKMLPYRNVSISIIDGRRKILKDATVKDSLREIWKDEKKYTTYVNLLKRIKKYIPILEEHESGIFEILENAKTNLKEKDSSHSDDISLLSEILILYNLGYIEELKVKKFKEMLDELNKDKKLRTELQKKLKNALHHLY